MVAAQETTLQDVLEGTKQYIVPLYQRPHQWGKAQLQDLWNDIIELTEDRQEGDRSSHFIGSLVLAPPPVSVAGWCCYLLGGRWPTATHHFNSPSRSDSGLSR